MRDETFESLVFLYTNREFCLEGFEDHLSDADRASLARVSQHEFGAVGRAFPIRIPRANVAHAVSPMAARNVGSNPSSKAFTLVLRSSVVCAI